MGKVKYIIAAAGLFVCFVLFFVMKTGVHLQERRIIRWSDVSSPEAAGEKVAVFMYPIIKKFKNIRITGGDDFTHAFIDGYLKRAQLQNPDAFIGAKASQFTGNHFTIEVMNIADAHSDLVCQGEITSPCVAAKSKRLFEKKERDLSKPWISMYRMGEKSTLLLYHE